MLKKFFRNAGKPEGFAGKIFIALMNKGHAFGSKWALSHLELKSDYDILDIGCGGGANIELLLKMCSKGSVTGIDYSPVSVEVSKKKNKKAIEMGKCSIIEANVLNLPFENEKFDVITAFETIYFWKPIETAFQEVYRVLKKDAVFMIGTETDGKSKMDEKWKNLIDNMEIYTGEQLEELLRKTGFKNIKISLGQKNNWMCVLAQK